MTSIADNAFSESQIAELTIHEGITSIGAKVFFNCAKLVTVNFNAVNVVNSPTSASSSIFYACDNVSTFNIGNRVTRIPESFCSRWEKLTSVTIPPGVTKLGNYVFESTGLLSIVIPESVTTIGRSVFGYCDDLHSVTVLRSTPPDVFTDRFGIPFTDPQNKHLTVPHGGLALYRVTLHWKDFGVIEAIAGTNANLASLSVSAGTHTPAPFRQARVRSPWLARLPIHPLP
jgi:hypothetical protein